MAGFLVLRVVLFHRIHGSSKASKKKKLFLKI
jgi:hypothetical protein